MSAPRPSTDVESAPLLHNEAEQDENEDVPWHKKLEGITEEPLTLLTKILLGVCLFLLLFASIFVGLFAGAEHKLNSGEPSHSEPVSSVTLSHTTTETHTETSVSTTTAIMTTTTTTTVIPPIPTPEPDMEVCMSTQCIILAADILSSMDASYDPCEDFYLFANNGWLQANPIPSDKGSYGHFEDVQLQNEGIVRQILETPVSDELDIHDRSTLEKVQGLYKECLDETKLDEIGHKPLLDVIRVARDLYNGSTSIEKYSLEQDIGLQTAFTEVTTAGLTAALAYMHSRDIGALFGFDLDGDIGVDPDKMTLWFWQPELGLPSKEYYKEADITELYRQTLEKLLFIAFEDEKVLTPPAARRWPPIPWPPWGDDDDDKPENSTMKAKRLSKEVLQFESKIASASQDLDELFDPIGSYNPVPFSNITASIPQINFGAYLSTFAPRAFPHRVIVTYPPYLPSLSNILDTAEKDVVEAYLISRIALSLSPFLGQETDAWKAVRNLKEILGGLKKGAAPDRAEYCAKVVNDVMGYATGRFFVEKAFGGESKNRSSELISNVIEAFKASLPKLNWMDTNSSTAAAEKASAIGVKVGYPMYPNTTNSNSIYDWYYTLDPAKDGYFGTVLQQGVLDQRRKWLKLGQMRNRFEWEMYASTVNAYFSPPANEIVFPAGIMRSPWFNVDWPGYLNYGGMGAIAAHELTHAFDSAGRMFNQQGKLEEWWTNSTSENFNVIQKCISKQYSSYTIDDGKGHQIHVNGELTSGENIADQGLVNSYRAWKTQYNSSLEDGTEYLLPGLNYTRDQLFFISFGRTWARNMRPASAVQRIRTDPHSPTKFRVEGTLSNIPEFAKAFNCSADAKLNPPLEKQCRLWS